MATLIRPEVLSAATRWREALVGLVILFIGLWWMVQTRGVLAYVSPLIAVAGAGLIVIGIQRGRFRMGNIGAGTVQVDEGQITYFGPQTGGAVAIADLERLTLNRSGAVRQWELAQPGQPELLIPIDAHGADALFDAFGRLPGLKTERMLKEMHAAKAGMNAGSVVIWERTPLRRQGLPLH